MNYSTLLDKESAGLATIEKVDDNYVTTYKQFNPDTGEEIESEVFTFPLATIDQNIADLTQQLKTYQDLKARLEKVV